MLRANTKSKPKMKLKAAEGRYFLPVLHTMLTKFFPCQTQHAKTRLKCAEALLSVYSELDSWVDGVSTIRLGQFGRKHLLLYAELSKSSRNELRWHLYPKHHLFCHVVESCLVNPKAEWNYRDEGCIGEAAEMAATANQSCASTSIMARCRATFEFGGPRVD
jgi:hypothetical protein